MREIKFRAFDKESAVWLDEDYFVILSNGSVLEVDRYGIQMDVIEENDNVVLEQYTGLKDKNGVDIYEGDIVAEITQFDDDEPDLYVVVYNETGEYPAFDLKGWTGEVNGISELSLTCGIEVIGNVHQNADLLNDTDRISPDDISNDIHKFLHGGDK